MRCHFLAVEFWYYLETLHAGPSTRAGVEIEMPSSQFRAYQDYFSNRRERAWMRPLRNALARLGNGYLFAWAARGIEGLSAGQALDILDVACGDAMFKTYLSPRHRYTGVDFSERPLARARKYFPGNYLRADIHDLPLSDCSFDVAVSLQTFQYLENPVKALRELSRILRPDGKLILSVPNPNSFKFKLKPLEPIVINRLQASEIEALLAPAFSVRTMCARGLWLPLPTRRLQIHFRGCYPEKIGHSWTVIAGKRS
jgi:SAM-dependent methyltransferase